MVQFEKARNVQSEIFKRRATARSRSEERYNEQVTYATVPETVLVRGRARRVLSFSSFETAPTAECVDHY